MKKLIIKCLFFLIPFILLFIISIPYKQIINIENEYQAAIIDKHDRIDKISQEKILLVGGSNLVFGIKSNLLEEECGMRVANLGLQAGLGSKFILNEAISSVRKNDVVIICLEYELYDENFTPSYDLINFTQTIYPKSLSYYSLDIRERFKIQIDNVKDIFESKSIVQDSVYSRRSIDEYGELKDHLTLSKSLKLKGRRVFTPISINSNIVLFKKLFEKCKSLNAKLFITFPSFAESEYNNNKIAIQTIKKQIDEKLDFIPQLDTPETYVFNDSLFFDTVYHLNSEGKKKRTKLLIEALKLKKICPSNNLLKNSKITESV